MSRPAGKPQAWVAVLAMLLGVALACALGVWQLGRAAQKNQWQAAQQAQLQAPALDGAGMAQLLQGQHLPTATPPAAAMHRPVQLRGQWLAAHTVYLDNRQMQGRPGFYVITPLQLEHGGVVLVQRGWVPRNFEQRQAVVAVDTPGGTVQLQGRTAAAPAQLWRMGDGDGVDATQPQIRQNLDLPRFAQDSGLPLWPLTVVQTGAASEGLLRDWPQPGSGVATHYGYAFQWFAMAAVLMGMLLWFFVLQPARRARQSRQAHVI